MTTALSSFRPMAVAGLLLGLAACDDAPGSRSARADSEPVQEYVVESAVITESSGLARSQRDESIFWTQNDSGGPTATYAVNDAGEFLGTLKITPAINLDWEDMSSFTEDGTPRLIVGDIGDNDAFRPFLNLYIVDEPDLAGATVPFTMTALVQRLITVLYPDGPRDSESLAVDAEEGFIYLLSKRDAVPQLYRVPLAPLVPVVVAEALGAINIPRAPEGMESPERINWTTSMDIDASGLQLAVLGLTQAHLYRRAAGESWQQALQRAPIDFDLPDYSQIEACAFSADGKYLWITSEGSPTPMARLPLPQ